MGQTNYLKILWAVLYLCFAGISCFATAESLHMSWNSIPEIVCWIIAIGFFLIASFGTSMIADSFNRNKFIKNRNLMLFGGIFIVLIFWIALLIPTNTHTFLYRNVAEKTLSTDLTKTENYLKNLDRGSALDQIINDKKDKVLTALANVHKELYNPANFGFGPETLTLMKEVERLTGVKALTNRNRNLTKSQVDALYKPYEADVKAALERWIQKTTEEYSNRSENEDQEIKTKSKPHKDAIRNISNDLKSGTLDIYNSENMSAINKTLESAYSYLALNHNPEIAKITQEDLPRYTSTPPETLVKHAISVAGLWGDILSGKAMNMGDVILYVIISILLDASAFVFFYLAFKKQS